MINTQFVDNHYVMWSILHMRITISRLWMYMDPLLNYYQIVSYSKLDYSSIFKTHKEKPVQIYIFFKILGMQSSSYYLILEVHTNPVEIRLFLGYVYSLQNFHLKNLQTAWNPLQQKVKIISNWNLFVIVKILGNSIKIM